MPKIILIKFIGYHYGNCLVSRFSIKKTYKFLAKKYYWPIFNYNIKTYVKNYDVCLIFQIIQHKLYNDLQFLPVLTYQYKDFLIDFIVELLIVIN